MNACHAAGNVNVHGVPIHYLRSVQKLVFLSVMDIHVHTDTKRDVMQDYLRCAKVLGNKFSCPLILIFKSSNAKTHK